MDDDSMTNDNDKICKATRADGEPCTVRALADGYCFAHSTTTAEKRHTARATGGRNKGAPQRVQRLIPHELRPVLSLLLTALTETHEGLLPTQQATALAALAGAISRLYGTVEVEARLAAIERELTDGHTA